MNVKQLLESLDNKLFAQLVEAAKGTCKTDDDIKAFVDKADVAEYRKPALMEYADKNKDLLLAMDTYTEMEPITATDAIAPVVVDNGKVKNSLDKHPEEEDEYDTPEAHPTHKGVVANESAEVKCIVILEDGSLEKVIVEDIELVEDLIREHYDQGCIVVFEENQTGSVSINEEKMTDEQKAKREEIVLAMKKHSRELKNRYGDDWEGVMYAIATKKAMSDTNDAEAVTESNDVMFTTTGKDGSTITISKDANDYYVLKQMNGKEVVDVQEFQSYEDAANTMHMLK